MLEEKFNRTDLDNLIREAREAKAAEGIKAQEEQEKENG